MFTKITPQKVQHSDGYRVQVADRYAVEYFDDVCHARIDVEFGSSVAVYLRSLIVKNLAGAVINLNLPEIEKILERIITGIEAMGCIVEKINHEFKGSASQ